MVQRRSIMMTVMALFAMLVTGTVGTAAQGATPAALFADTMGLPELHVQVTDSEIEGVPAETPAGRYLLTVDVTAADGGSVGFMQLPAGMSRDDFVAMLAGPSASPGPSMATPEGELALAQATLYLALAPKSNAAYLAFKAAGRDAKEHGSLPPPAHILNAPTALMRKLGYGQGYAYDHDVPDRFSGQDYFPDGMGRQRYYAPTDEGFEAELRARAERLDRLRRERGAKA